MVQKQKGREEEKETGGRRLGPAGLEAGILGSILSLSSGHLTSPVYPPVWVNLVPASEDSWKEASGPLSKLGDGYPNVLPSSPSPSHLPPPHLTTLRVVLLVLGTMSWWQQQDREPRILCSDSRDFPDCKHLKFG